MSSTPLGEVTHEIWYDQVTAARQPPSAALTQCSVARGPQDLQMVRWDRDGYLESPSERSRLILITNYTDLAAGPPEYVYYPQQNKCLVYGADAFYPWCFGQGTGQTYAGQFQVGRTLPCARAAWRACTALVRAANVYDEWVSVSNAMTWTSDSNVRVPRERALRRLHRP